MCFFHFAVFEEATGSSKVGSKKALILSKLPQRVRNTSTVSYSDEEGDSVGPGQEKTSSKTRGQRAESKKAAENAAGDAEAPRSPPQPRRETFVVRRDVELLSTGSVEDIANMPMPDLVSGSPMKDDVPEVFESSQQAPAQAAQAENVAAQSSTDEIKCKNKPSVTQTKESAAVEPSKNKRKSGGKNMERGPGKANKGTAIKQPAPAVPSVQKDASFFISNPCSLNLVHKRVTGSAEGCLGSNTGDKAKPVSTVDVFVAAIKESNRKSAKVASFISADDPNNVQKPQRSEEKPNVQKLQRPFDATSAPESDKPDETMFFDTDMDFTEVLPQTHTLVSLAERQGGADKPLAGKETNADCKLGTDRQPPRGTETKARSKSKTKEPVEKREGRKHTRTKSGRRPIVGKGEEVTGGSGETDGEQAGSGEGRKRAVDAAVQREETDSEQAGLGEDKKLAVALRVNKPGHMVFAAARKEEDGSRKAIPAKLHAKARSKSKKQMEEMMKNLPQKEPESIFDFHDQTPRPAVTDGNVTKQQSSVFDLSLNDTAPGIAPSLTTFREKMNVVTKQMKVHGPESAAQAEQTDKACKRNKGQPVDGGKPVVPSLLGDAPVYRLRLKDDNSDQPEPRSRSRGRSASTNREPARQSRSKSRSRRNDEKEAGENVDPDNQNRRGRSKSRTRSGTKEADNETDVEVLGESRESSGRSRGRKSRQADVEQEEDSSDGLRRSTRSKSKVRKTYDDSEENLSDLSGGKETATGRSKSKIQKDDEDEEYKPTRTADRAQQRGRSRRRKDGDEDLKTSDAEEAKRKPVEQRGRSRSRRRVEGDESSEREAGQNAVNEKQANQNCTQGTEPESDAKDNKTTPVQQLTGSSNKTVSDKPRGGNSESSTAESDSGAEPVMMVTNRRQRTKSSYRKLYNQPDSGSDLFGFPFDLVEASLDSQAISTAGDGKDSENKTRNRTRSRGSILQKDKEGQPSHISPKADNVDTSPPRTSSQAHQERETEKRKSSDEDSADSGEREDSPSKKLCTDRKKSKKHSSGSVAKAAKDADNFEQVSEMDSLSERKLSPAEESGIAPSSPSVKKKRTSSLPIAVTHVGEEKSRHSPTSAEGSSKKDSKIPEPKATEKVSNANTSNRSVFE